MPSLSQRFAHSTIAGLVAFLVIVGIGLGGLRIEQDRHLEEMRNDTISTASRVRADLEKALEQRIFMVEGLAGFAVADLAADLEIDEEQFLAYAADLEADSAVPIRSLQLAPQGVVEHIHPLAGNEAAIGHDLLEDPARRAAVMEAVELRKPMVAGPFELLQGGLAIVVRKPIFWSSGPRAGQWWGLATVVADIPPLFAEVGIDGSDASLDGYRLALRGRDQQGGSGDAFFGDADLYTGLDEPVLFDVTLPSGSWQLAMLPNSGWDRWHWPRSQPYFASVLLLALIMAVLVSRYAASRSEARRVATDLGNLVETARAPIADVDSDGIVVRWNQEMAELTGVPARDVIGRRILDGGPNDPMATALTSQCHGRLAEVLLTAEDDNEAKECNVERVDGQQTPVLVSVATRHDARGKPAGVVIVCQDISSRIEAEQVRAENEAIERTARLKDEFLANMSHELRTPLNGVIGLSSILSKRTFGPLNDKQGEYVDQISSSGRHLLALINDVLDLAKIEADQVDLDVTKLDLGRLVADAAAVLREAAIAAGHSIRIDVPSEALVVRGDARRLKQIVLNLLSNAIKFTPQDGDLGIIVRDHDGKVEIEVWDTGIGIAAEKQDRLFRPFQQIDSALNRTYEGSGLGLALTAKLAELHGGGVRVDSAPNEGSRFTVNLPHTMVVTHDQSRSKPTHAPTPVDQDADEGPLKVLVAEDNLVNRRMIADVLQVNGMTVIQAANGVEAVDLARRHRPDIVLMDIQMPIRDGLAATRMLKADDALALIPVVAVTALAMAGDAERCLSAGCDAYVSKPLDIDELLQVIDDLTTQPATT